MHAYSEGKPRSLPYRVTRHLVAARYGRSPLEVDEWPAADFLDALSLLGVTGGR